MVRALDCVEVEWVESGCSSGMEPHEKTGPHITIEADLVLLAMGFSGPAGSALVDSLGLECAPDGFPVRNECWMTSRPGIFVSGDMWRGASLVVHAIADGIRCGGEVERYLGA